ncbi:MAG: hypothetical protein HY815_28980, partial [Candidatus Riflebacteria bacterium]|nr:hypothetical protein [Candidatus Riflebacteria bacterium]
MTLSNLAKALVDRNAELVVLKAGKAPSLKTGTSVEPLAGLPTTSNQDLEQFFLTFVKIEKLRELGTKKRMDLAVKLGSVGMFRVSLALEGLHYACQLSALRDVSTPAAGPSPTAPPAGGAPQVPPTAPAAAARPAPAAGADAPAPPRIAVPPAPAAQAQRAAPQPAPARPAGPAVSGGAPAAPPTNGRPCANGVVNGQTGAVEA